MQIDRTVSYEFRLVASLGSLKYALVDFSFVKFRFSKKDTNFPVVLTSITYLLTLFDMDERKIDLNSKIKTFSSILSSCNNESVV